MLCDGELMGFTLKQHLAGDGIHYEPRWFRKWPTSAVERIELKGLEVPVGAPNSAGIPQHQHDRYGHQSGAA
jgi:hypothetical protein